MTEAWPTILLCFALGALGLGLCAAWTMACVRWGCRLQRQTERREAAGAWPGAPDADADADVPPHPMARPKTARTPADWLRQAGMSQDDLEALDLAAYEPPDERTAAQRREVETV